MWVFVIKYGTKLWGRTGFAVIWPERESRDILHKMPLAFCQGKNSGAAMEEMSGNDLCVLQRFLQRVSRFCAFSKRVWKESSGLLVM